MEDSGNLDSGNSDQLDNLTDFFTDFIIVVCPNPHCCMITKLPRSHVSSYAVSLCLECSCMYVLKEGLVQVLDMEQTEIIKRSRVYKEIGPIRDQVYRISKLRASVRN